jgi:pilus assembly protein Flp/PilA
MIKTLKALARDEEGATMVEYALMVALVAAVAVAAVTTLGKNVSTVFNTVAGTI